MGKFSLHNRTGITIAEVVVALAIFGLLGTVFASSFVEIFKAQKLVETKDRANDFSSAVGRFLYKNSSCKRSLVGTQLPSGNEKREFTLKDFAGFGGDDNTLDISSGTVIDTVLRIKSLTIQDAGISPTLVRSDGLNYNRLNARIKMSVEIRTKNIWSEIGPRFYEIPVFTRQGNRRIELCSVEMELADACQVLGSTFDKSKGECKPQTQCIMRGHYINSKCNPGSGGCPPSLKNIFTKSLNCPADSVASQTGKFNYSFTESCGKKCSRSVKVKQAFYICLKCT